MNLYTWQCGEITYLIAAKSHHEAVERLLDIYGPTILQTYDFNKEQVKVVSNDFDKEIIIVFGSARLVGTGSFIERKITP